MEHASDVETCSDGIVAALGADDGRERSTALATGEAEGLKPQGATPAGAALRPRGVHHAEERHSNGDGRRRLLVTAVSCDAKISLGLELSVERADNVLRV